MHSHFSPGPALIVHDHILTETDVVSRWGVVVRGGADLVRPGLLLAGEMHRHPTYDQDDDHKHAQSEDEHDDDEPRSLM